MQHTQYSSLACQKTSAVLVSSVCCSFFPDTSIRACEIDGSGFDIVLKSSHELIESSFLVLQEEIRRQRAKVSIRSYSMMMRVLKSYVVQEKKVLGPYQNIPENALVDVCEINSYCVALSGPHEEDGLALGNIALVGYCVSREGSGWLWHIRGTSLSGKKANKVVEVQKTFWEKDADSILEECSAKSGDVFLPKGVHCKKKLISLLTLDAEEWIEETDQNEIQVASNEDLIDKLMRKRPIIKELGQDSAYESLKVQWPVRHREPLGSLVHQTTLVHYSFSQGLSTVGALLALFQKIRLSYSVTIFSTSRAACQQLHDIISRELSSEVLVEYEISSGSFSYIVVHGQHADGRSIPLSSFVIDFKRKELLLGIVAFSVERWLGLLTELCGTLPPFFTKNRLAFLMVNEVRSSPVCVEVKKHIEEKGIECQFLLCRASDTAKKIMELRQEGICYVAVVGEREIQAGSFLLYTGTSKKGYTCTFKDLGTFFDGLPIKEEA